VDGLIIPKLTLEEKIEIDNLVKEKLIDIISLVALSSKNRIKDI